MRIHVLLRAALIVAALALPLAGVAQRFQEPTKEELQMTSDPKAPGAPAVFLYREDSTDNHNHYVSSYARIKVLTELGKKWATVEIPYVPGRSAPPIIVGRTIHSDGTIVPLAGKAEDLLVIKDHNNNVKTAVFNMPSVEVGSILEYKWTIPLTGSHVEGVSNDDSQEYMDSAAASSIPEWIVQQPIYVHKEYFYFHPFMELSLSYMVDGELANYLMYTQHLPAGKEITRSIKNDYTLEISDVPAAPEESNSPPLASFLYRVRFYYAPYPTPEIYWDNEVKRWSKQLDQFAAPNSHIQAAAAQITAGTDSPEVKAHKLYDAVQALDNTDFTRAKDDAERKQLHLKSELKRAEDVWTEKSGSGNDIAALYLALARASGLNADGMKVASREWEIFDPSYLSLDQLDALLVVLHIDGKDIYLDPGQKLCPFGQLQWTHMLAGGIEENVKEPTHTPPNLAKDAVTAHTADLTLGPSGKIDGTAKILIDGPEALRWRQLNLTSDTDEVKKSFNESLHGLLPPGVVGEVEQFQGLDSSVGFLTAVVKVTGQLGTTAGKHMLLPGFFFSSSAHSQFVSDEKREAAIDLHYAEQIIDDVVYHLPAGFTVESAPQAAQLAWPDHAALVIKTASGPSAIDIKHIFARAFVVLGPQEYAALRDYYKKIATADQQQVVLAGSGATVAGK